MVVIGITKEGNHYAQIEMEHNDIDEALMFAVVLQRTLKSEHGWVVQTYIEEKTLKPIY